MRKKSPCGLGWLKLLNSQNRRPGSVFDGLLAYFYDERCHGIKGGVAVEERMEVVTAPSERGKTEEKKKKGIRRVGEERTREEEGPLVRAEIAQPLTILRYYVRSFLHRSLHSLARTNWRPSWNMELRRNTGTQR